jgi:hypothetical protein
MIMPIPPEMSQVSVPALVRSGPWAMVGAGRATAAATAKTAKALTDLSMSNSFMRCVSCGTNATQRHKFRFRTARAAPLGMSFAEELVSPKKSWFR